MYTPQEVREGTTSFDRSFFGGYNMQSVDDFLTPLVEDYSALYKENAVLKTKMKVLVEKLEEFHQREDSMNKAILAAQEAADEMIAGTERKCAKMLSETEENMRQRKLELGKEMAIEAERVARAKKTAGAFILHVEDQMKKAVAQLESLREMTLTPREKKPAPAAPVIVPPAPRTETRDPAQMSREIELNISRILGAQDAALQEPSDAAAPEEPQESHEAAPEVMLCEEPQQDPGPQQVSEPRQRTPEEILSDTIVLSPIQD